MWFDFDLAKASLAVAMGTLIVIWRQARTADRQAAAAERQAAAMEATAAVAACELQRLLALDAQANAPRISLTWDNHHWCCAEWSYFTVTCTGGPNELDTVEIRVRQESDLVAVTSGDHGQRGLALQWREVFRGTDLTFDGHVVDGYGWAVFDVTLSRGNDRWHTAVRVHVPEPHITYGDFLDEVGRDTEEFANY
ncbi:hypothetical protein Lfu02_74340 [Longispora fulva]|uniref:Uncharacterized protein n=1 Tax=Longispora fulva TaxID=619741 RepID=A0A8J7GMI9_9ACTN|nr:hypothetical protein [Longispora fulva]MBG6134353.1 hypothetical protein [Longispora fulva]GIG63062.1 hypothetical protein Lfu02_74340 [Longispora fulva]